MPIGGTLTIEFGVKPGEHAPDQGSPFALMACEANDPLAIDRFVFTADVMAPPQLTAERINAEVTRICARHMSRLGISTQGVLTADIAMRIGGTIVQQVFMAAQNELIAKAQAELDAEAQAAE